MSATSDLQAAQAAMDKAVSDGVAAMQAAATTISNLAAQIAANNGVSSADAEAVVTDLNAKAAALETAAQALSASEPAPAPAPSTPAS